MYKFMHEKAIGFNVKAASYMRVAFLQAGSFLSGFLLSRTTVFGSYSPLGIAVTCGMPKYFTLTAALGAILGYIVPVNGGMALKYIGGILIAAALKWFLGDLSKFTKTPAFAALTAFIASLFTSFITITLATSNEQPLVTCAVEGLMAIGGAYFIYRSVPLIGNVKGIRSLTSEEIVCCVISLSFALMAFTSLNIGGLSPARIISVLLILGAARYGRETTGAVAGIAAGFAMTVSSENMPFIVGAYALGGLLAGIFSPLGKVGSVVAFILANAIMVLSFGSQISVLTELYEVSAGTIIFIAMPKGFGKKLSEFFSPAPQMPRVDGLRKMAVMRLKFASAALGDVSGTVDEVSKRLQKINSPELDEVFERVEEEACRRCGLRIYCFETSRAETIGSFIEMTKIMRKSGKITKEEYPEELQKRCSYINDVAASLNRHFLDYLSKESAERRISEVQSVVSDQFSGISDMLYDMADEFEKAVHYDIESAGRIETALRSIGIIATDICCCIDKFGRMSVEICADNEDKLRVNKATLLNEICTATDRKFNPPCISGAGKSVLISLSQKAAYRLDIGVTQYSCGENRMCGDAYEYFNDGKGRKIMVISDGMGSGGRAAVDGAMASGLMSRLIKAGFGFECSLKIVNSAMLFKSTDESLATIDIACMDLFTGKIEFLKAGAPESIVRKGGKIGKAVCSSFPAGILRNVEFDRTDATISAGDIVVMISDGANTEGTAWIADEILKWKNGSAQQLSNHLAACAKRRRADGREDDITVLAAIVEKEV